MSKIICDICGTTYPENAAQCPICGSAKNADSESVSEDSVPAENKEETGYTHTKGGRFSKSNVKKRIEGSVPAPEYSEEEPEENEDENDEGSNRGLIITVILLLLAIAAVIIYIWTRFFSGDSDVPGNQGNQGDPVPTGSSISASTETTVPTTVPQTIPCTGITLNQSTIMLDEVDSAWLLNVSLEPQDTTDTIVYESSNPDVASVSESGKVTAVAPGTAMITITCGDVSTQCVVICEFDAGETTEPTEEVTEPTTKPTEPEGEKLGLNRSDITFSKSGDSWQLYTGDIDEDEITFFSADESVATFEDGKVTAVGAGRTTVYAEYKDQKASCIIRCKFEETDTTEPDTTEPEETTPDETVSNETYQILINGALSPFGAEATIEAGDSFKLSLADSQGNTVTVTWTVKNTDVCTVDGNKVVGVGSGNTTVSCTYNGKTYTCIVRVK